MKRYFTQGIAILLEQAVTLEEIEPLLTDFKVLAHHPAHKDWTFSGPSLTLAYPESKTGKVEVDVVDRSWPDMMGSNSSTLSDNARATRKNGESALFQAWNKGFFGPFTYPGSLERAIEQAWLWPDAKEVVPDHKAFLRLRITYAKDAASANNAQSEPVVPDDYEAEPELEFLTRLALQLCALPQALCYFNPNAESLCSGELLEEAWESHIQEGQRPLDIWSNRRLFRLADVPDWNLMDTVGMLQLDVVDHEACYPIDAYDPNEVATFLMNVADYTLSDQEEINDGDTADGPGKCLWQAYNCDQSLLEPPRPVLRWFPLNGTDIPVEFLPPQVDEDDLNGDNDESIGQN